MCRSIKQLRGAAISPTEVEIRAAALQFVRKISGYRKPSRANSAAFELAVEEVGAATLKLLTSLGVEPAPGIEPAYPPESARSVGSLKA